MNYQRITVSIPNHLYEDLITMVGKGKISAFVTESARKMILKKKTTPKEAISNFWSLREKAPRRTTKQILESIHKGRV